MKYINFLFNFVSVTEWYINVMLSVKYCLLVPCLLVGIKRIFLHNINMCIFIHIKINAIGCLQWISLDKYWLLKMILHDVMYRRNIWTIWLNLLIDINYVINKNNNNVSLLQNVAIHYLYVNIFIVKKNN